MRRRRDNPFVEDGRALVSRVVASGDVKASARRALDLLGGLPRLLEGGETVLVKPNFVVPAPPPVTTGLDLVRAVVELLQEAGAGEVVLGESSLWSKRTRGVLEALGVPALARELGCRLLPFEEGPWVRVRSRGRWFRRPRVPRAVLEVDCLVYLPALKTHRLAQFSGTLKMAMGIVRKPQRAFVHLYGLRHKVVDVASAVLPDLALVDARTCFVSGGPMEGVVRKPGLLLASGDAVALDVESVRVIQSFPGHGLPGDPWRLTQIRRAAKLGLGARSETDYRLVSEGAQGL